MYPLPFSSIPLLKLYFHESIPPSSIILYSLDLTFSYYINPILLGEPNILSLSIDSCLLRIDLSSSIIVETVSSKEDIYP